MRHRILWAWLVACLLPALAAAQVFFIPPSGGGGGSADGIAVTPFGTIESEVLQDMLEEIVAEAAGGSGAPTDATYVVLSLDAGLSQESQLGASVIMAGSLAARPAAGTHGRLYYVTDAGDQRWTRDTGLAWVDTVVDWSYVANVQVVAGQLAANAVGASNIGAGEVTLSKLSSDVTTLTGDALGSTLPNIVIAPDSVALVTDTTGSHLADVTSNQGLVRTGSAEGGTVGVIDCDPLQTIKRMADDSGWECGDDLTGGGGGGTPGGADTQVQYNDGGAFGGDSGLTYDETTNVLTVAGGVVANLTGNASTATALAANPSNCAAGNAPLGVDASGAAENCFDVFTQAEFTTHEADTTSVHGIADTSLLALTSDARFPTSDQKAALAGTGTPSGANPYVVSNDARMTNARTPTAHASSHYPGGTDDISSIYATKVYADAIVTGLDIKAHVLVVPTANVTLSGEQTIQGILTSNSRVGLVHQTDLSENGIWITAAGAWTRAADADAGAEVNPGMFFFVADGELPPTGYAKTQWVLLTSDPITVGTTDLEFTIFGSQEAVVAGDGLTLTGDTLAVGAGTCLTVGANDVGITAGCITTTEISGTAAITKAQISNTGTWETSEIPGITSAMITDDEIVNADIDAAAAIAESKLALNFATHSNANDPTANQKAALAGTAGSPSVSNPYVTTEDVRLSDAREPEFHAATHAQNGADPLGVGTPVVGGDANAEGSANTYARSDHVHKLLTKVRSNGSAVGTRHAVNFIPGANISLGVADDAASDEVDVIITAADMSAPPTVTADSSCVDEYPDAIHGTTCVEQGLDAGGQPYSVVYHCTYPENAGSAAACDDLVDWSRVGGPLNLQSPRVHTHLTAESPYIFAGGEADGSRIEIFGDGLNMDMKFLLSDDTEGSRGFKLEAGRDFTIAGYVGNTLLPHFTVEADGIFQYSFIQTNPSSAECASEDHLFRVRYHLPITGTPKIFVCYESSDGVYAWSDLSANVPILTGSQIPPAHPHTVVQGPPSAGSCQFVGEQIRDAVNNRDYVCEVVGGNPEPLDVQGDGFVAISDYTDSIDGIAESVICTGACETIFESHDGSVKFEVDAVDATVKRVKAKVASGVACSVFEGVTDTSADDQLVGSLPFAVTVTSVWVHYTGSTPPDVAAQFALVGMTHSTVVAAGPTAASTPQAVTGGAVAAYTPVRVAVGNTPDPITDTYEVCYAYTR